MISMGDAPIAENPQRVQGVADLTQGFYMLRAFSIPAAQTQRHGGKFNLQFCDSHVSMLTTKDLYDSASDNARSLWNKDGLPHH
jgi:prepilin-type processing-associated H-X9-DG protein